MLEFIDRHWLALSLASLMLITAGSLWPLAQLPELPGNDKTHHLVAYAVLALPIALHRPSCWLFFLTACLLWSGVIELIQPMVNRYAEWRDFFANGCGLAIGALLGHRLRCFFNSALGHSE